MNTNINNKFNLKKLIKISVASVLCTSLLFSTSLTSFANDKDYEAKKIVTSKVDTDYYEIIKKYTPKENGVWDVEVSAKGKNHIKDSRVVILLDTSREMAKNGNLEKAKKYTMELYRNILSKKENNEVEVITFNSNIVQNTGFQKSSNTYKLTEAIKNTKTSGYLVDGTFLQKTIHQAKTDLSKFNDDKYKHIIILSTGKANYSYNNKKSFENSLNIEDIKEESVPVTNYFGGLVPYETQYMKHNLLTDLESFAKLIKKEIPNLDLIKSSLNNILIKSISPINLDNVSVKEIKDSIGNENRFDYDTRVGEGTHIHSYYKTIKGKPVLDTTVNALRKYLNIAGLKNKFDDINKSHVLKHILEKMYGKNLVYIDDLAPDSVIKFIMQTRDYILYNHSESAVTEAKLAKNENIIIDSYDFNTENKYKNYLTRMIGGYNTALLSDINVFDINAPKTLNKISLNEEVQKEYDIIGNISSNTTKKPTKSSGSWFLLESSNYIDWEISKDELESGQEKKLNYTIKLKDLKNNKSKDNIKEIDSPKSKLNILIGKTETKSDIEQAKLKYILNPDKEPPMENENKPQDDLNKPKDDVNKPKDDVNKPKDDVNKPKDDVNKHKDDVNKHNENENNPKDGQKDPIEPDKNLPKDSDNNPIEPDKNLPKDNENKPKVDENKPKVNENKPKVNENKPKVDENTSKGDEKQNNIPKKESPKDNNLGSQDDNSNINDDSDDELQLIIKRTNKKLSDIHSDLEKIKKDFISPIANTYDIYVLNKNKERVPELKNKVAVKILEKELGINDKNRNSLRIFTNHKSNLEEIKDFKFENGALVFERNKFSDFVFLVENTKNNHYKNNPKTGDNGTVGYIILASLTSLSLAIIYSKKNI